MFRSTQPTCYVARILIIMQIIHDLPTKFNTFRMYARVIYGEL